MTICSPLSKSMLKKERVKERDERSEGEEDNKDVRGKEERGTPRGGNWKITLQNKRAPAKDVIDEAEGRRMEGKTFFLFEQKKKEGKVKGKRGKILWARLEP